MSDAGDTEAVVARKRHGTAVAFFLAGPCAHHRSRARWGDPNPRHAAVDRFDVGYPPALRVE